MEKTLLKKGVLEKCVFACKSAELNIYKLEVVKQTKY